MYGNAGLLLESLLTRNVWSRGALAILLAATGNAPAADFVYEVQPGDHPWNVAVRYLKHPSLARALQRYNQIPDDRRVMPGTRLRIPEEWLRLQTTRVRVLACTGDVLLTEGPAVARTPVEGETLQAPSVLRTGSTGSASLEFADGSRVLLLRESEVALHEVAATVLSDTRLVTLELLRGGLENDVRPAGAGARFQIRTPAATAAVRGTTFRTHLVQDALRTEVLQGAVQVENAQGAILAREAEGSVARMGSAPQPPAPLLAAPDLSSLPEVIERLPIDLPLVPLAGAVGFRSQAALDAGFRAMLSDESVQTPRLRMRDLPDGNYWFRVRGVDAQGLEGRSAERALRVHTQPEPPLLIHPPADLLLTAQPHFRWTAGTADGGYRLQVLGEGAGAPLLDIVVVQADLEPSQTLPPGRYRWRVAAVSTRTGPGPWSDPQPFRRLLDAPGAMQIGGDVDADPRAPTLQWRAVAQAERYRLQVAQGEDFSTPTLDVTTEQPRQRVQGLASGAYQVRVQAIDAQGQGGGWSVPQRFDIPEPPPSLWPRLLLLLPLLLL